MISLPSSAIWQPEEKVFWENVSLAEIGANGRA